MKRMTKIFSLLLSVILVLSMTFTAFGDVAGEKGKLSDLKDKKEQNAKKQQELEASKAKAEAYIEEVDRKLTNLSTDIYNTGKKLEQTQDKIKKTEKKLKAAEESVTVQYADMKLRIQYMYENGDTQLLDLILNSSSITEFLNKAEYITELSQYDRKMLTKLKDTRKEIADSKIVLEKEEKNLVTMQAKQKKDQADLENTVASKQKELSGYEELLHANEASAEALNREIKAQEQKVADAINAMTEPPTQAPTQAPAQQPAGSNDTPKTPAVNPGHSSGWIYPVPGHTSVSSNYGYRKDPFSGASSFHNGIDFPAPGGTPIVAVADGTVVWANYNATAGNWTGIRHSNGVTSVYMHQSSILVSVGQHVSQGQTIGLVGTTGSSTGNHLHLGATSGSTPGNWVNPWSYF